MIIIILAFDPNHYVSTYIAAHLLCNREPKMKTKHRTTIIAGVDFTASSYNAARYAAMLAEKLKCKLTLFNMFDVPMIHSNSGLYFMSYSSIRDVNVDKLGNFSKKMQKEYPQLDLDYFVATGSFKEEIATFIKKHHVYAVVLGLATKTRFSKFLYGSHTTDLAGKVEAPVIIVPEQYKEHSVKKVVMGVDNREKLHKASLKRFEEFLRQTKAGLKVLHVRTEDELFDHNKSKNIIINHKKYPIEALSEGTLERGMRHFTLDNKVDLIGIISRKHSVFYNLFNETNTANIAFTSKVPVMAIHE